MNLDDRVDLSLYLAAIACAGCFGWWISDVRHADTLIEGRLLEREAETLQLEWEVTREELGASGMGLRVTGSGSGVGIRASAIEKIKGGGDE